MSREREAAKAARNKRRADKLARKKEKRQQQKLRSGDSREHNGGESHFSGKKEVWLMPGSASAQVGVASSNAIDVALDETKELKDNTEQEETESESLSQVGVVGVW